MINFYTLQGRADLAKQNHIPKTIGDAFNIALVVNDLRPCMLYQTNEADIDDTAQEEINKYCFTRMTEALKGTNTEIYDYKGDLFIYNKSTWTSGKVKQLLSERRTDIVLGFPCKERISSKRGMSVTFKVSIPSKTGQLISDYVYYFACAPESFTKPFRLGNGKAITMSVMNDMSLDRSRPSGRVGGCKVTYRLRTAMESCLR